MTDIGKPVRKYTVVPLSEPIPQVGPVEPTPPPPPRKPSVAPAAPAKTDPKVPEKVP